MKKKNRLIIIGFILILVITACAVIARTRIHIDRQEESIFENTDGNQRILINNFLQKNPYISYMNSFNEGLATDTDIVKSALYSKDVTLDYIITEEIDENEILSTFEGYKKSIENIRQYVKEVFKIENLNLNFIDTFYNETGYLLLNGEYVYYTMQEIPEKIFVTVGQKQQGDFLQIQIFEYTVNGNKEILDNMLQTGIIDESINTSNKFVLKIKIEDGKISVLEKD